MTPAQREAIDEKFRTASDAIAALFNDRTIPDEAIGGCLARLAGSIREYRLILTAGIVPPLDIATIADRASLADHLQALAEHVGRAMPGDDAAANAIGQAQDMLRDARVGTAEYEGYDDDDEPGE